MPDKISLGEFVKYLIASLPDNTSIPFYNEKLWHLLFYHLKTEEGKGKPEFFDNLRFDWDGPYPKSRDLSDFLHALHWNSSVSANNPNYDTISLSKEITKIWNEESNSLSEDELSFLNEAKEKAIKEFEIRS